MRAAAVAIACGIGIAASSAFAGEAGDAGLSNVGGDLFAQYCVACHGASATGDGPAAGALLKKPADLTGIAARRGGKFPEAEIARFIDGSFDLPAHGSREMPIWGEKLGAPIAEGTTHDEVVRGKVLTLIEYLKTIQKP